MKDCGGMGWLEKSCSKLNGKRVAGKSYLWRPFYTGIDDCWVRCRAVGQMFYARLAAAHNGAPCRPSGVTTTRHGHVCISSKCIEVGCDGIVGSGRREDKCGVCGGSETSCRFVAGLLTTPAMTPGYNYLTTIPVNASAISISLLYTRSKNHLALRKRDGTYILNGKKSLSPSGEYQGVSTNFYYQDNLSGKGEMIKSSGPISEPLDLMLIYQEPNSGVKYEYRLATTPTKEYSKDLTVKSSFPHDRTSNSSSPVNGNIYYARQGKTSYSHIQDPYKKSRDNARTGNRIRLKKKKFSWKISGFSECSKTCGGGVHKPLLVCVRESTDATVLEKKCSSIERPAIVAKPCNSMPCSYRWHTGRWGSCSATCGIGHQHREVACVPAEVPGGVNQKVQGCQHLHQPPSRRQCSLPPCDAQSASTYTDQWIVTQWSECSTECGKGFQVRSVACFGGQCDSSKRPEDRRQCLSDRKCKAQWFSGPWQMCVGSCGTGVQVRTVLCMAHVHGSQVVTEEGHCERSEKPLSSRACLLNPCNSTWFMTYWNECSKTCDSGIQKREVKCLSVDLKPSSACNETEKPLSYHTCNATPCHQNDDDCIDKLHNCPTVVQARLCSYNYYNHFCCHSCRRRS